MCVSSEEVGQAEMHRLTQRWCQDGRARIKILSALVSACFLSTHVRRQTFQLSEAVLSPTFRYIDCYRFAGDGGQLEYFSLSSLKLNVLQVFFFTATTQFFQVLHY